jgi:lipopolysaccharide/colanic/teichoic acid biosynthesis glycosyltransferase
VSGRNALSWDDKLALDVEYVDQRSLRLDVAVVLRTVTSVLRRDGITAEGETTMPEFMGSNQ